MEASPCECPACATTGPSWPRNPQAWKLQEEQKMGHLDPRQDRVLYGCSPRAWRVMPELSALTAGCLISSSCIITPGRTLDVDVQYIFLSAEVASCQGFRGRRVFLCSPKDRVVILFLSLPYFPPGILLYTAQLPPQPGLKVSQHDRSHERRNRNIQRVEQAGTRACSSTNTPS